MHCLSQNLRHYLAQNGKCGWLKSSCCLCDSFKIPVLRWCTPRFPPDTWRKTPVTDDPIKFNQWKPSEVAGTRTQKEVMRSNCVTFRTKLSLRLERDFTIIIYLWNWSRLAPPPTVMQQVHDETWHRTVPIPCWSARGNDNMEVSLCYTIYQLLKVIASGGSQASASTYRYIQWAGQVMYHLFLLPAESTQLLSIWSIPLCGKLKEQKSPFFTRLAVLSLHHHWKIHVLIHVQQFTVHQVHAETWSSGFLKHHHFPIKGTCANWPYWSWSESSLNFAQ